MPYNRMMFQAQGRLLSFVYLNERPIMLRVLLIVTALMINSVGEADAAKLMLNTGTRAPYTTEAKTGFLDLVIAEVFRRIGHQAEVPVYGASARALSDANEGIDDGAAMRVKGLEKKYPNLIRVPEKVIDNDFVAYSKNLRVNTNSWVALKAYDVAYILGWKVFERGLKGAKNVTLPRNADQLITLIKNDRVDIILYERWQGLKRAKDQGLKLRVHEPPLAKREMYMYLHKKHAALVDGAAKALADMKRDGTYQAIIDKTLTPLR